MHALELERDVFVTQSAVCPAVESMLCFYFCLRLFLDLPHSDKKCIASGTGGFYLMVLWLLLYSSKHGFITSGHFVGLQICGKTALVSDTFEFDTTTDWSHTHSAASCPCSLLDVQA